MEKYVAFFGLCFIIFVIGLMESADVIHYQDEIVVSDMSPEEEVNASPEDEVLLEELIPTLEMEYVDTEVVNGNTVEVYREFEVYRDKNNNIIKKVPTDHYEYLEYWR
ncbi:hypothetical protein ACLM5H_00290 [Fredinandcohnia humi]